MMSKIISIGTATPAFKHEQKNILEFMLKTLSSDEKTRKTLPILYHRSGIESRYSVLPDFSLSYESTHFFDEEQKNPLIDKRMALFNHNALDLSLRAIEDCYQSLDYQDITHLITVSCTGLSAPGLDIQLMQKLNLRPNIVRTSVNFMGCYAALHALKLADAFCQSSSTVRVLVVCTELCTIHFQESNDTDAVLSSTLFADGSAACIVSNEKEAKGIEIKSFHSKVALQGKTDMAWEVSNTGFLMKLTNHIPQLIKAEIKHLLEEALAILSLSIHDIHHWAVHPGGKNILEAINHALLLDDKALQHSYKILKNFGNMSSPTVLFVMKEIMQEIKPQQNVFMVAFGPGITMESLVLSS